MYFAKMHSKASTSVGIAGVGITGVGIAGVGIAVCTHVKWGA